MNIVIRVSFIIACLCICFNAVCSQQVIYVDSAAGGANNGFSWLNAFNDLQDALAAADSTDEIWVAKGMYFPFFDSISLTPFIMKSGVSLYGGFAGNESGREQRNWITNKTILSGDIGIRGDTSDNAPKIIVAEQTNGHIYIDGFIMGDGHAVQNAQAPNYNYTHGAAIWAEESYLFISNCIFRRNFAETAGGAIYASNSYVYVGDCVFENNHAKGNGGAILNRGGGLISNCLFYQNVVGVPQNYNGTGGAIYVTGTIVINCIFRENHSYNAGGAVFCWFGKYIDCLFEENTSRRSGGAMYALGSNITEIHNCNFIKNSVLDSLQNGGAIYVDQSPGTYGFRVYNSRFLNNTATLDGGAMELRWTKARIQSCEFIGNYAGRNGGAIRFVSGTGKCDITNSTFYQNNSAGDGKVIYDYVTHLDSTRIRNCIFWNNGTPEILNQPNPSRPTSIGHCILQGNINGFALADTLPDFVDPDGVDNILGTLDDNFRLQPGSPAIGTGTFDTSGLWLIPADMDRSPRINGIIDLGAFEYHDCNLNISMADAGMDTTVCFFNYLTHLNAISPIVGVGRWYPLDHYHLVNDIYAPDSRVGLLHDGENKYEWRVTYCGSEMSDTVTMTLTTTPSAPVIQVVGSSTICPGDSARLSVVNPVGSYTYLWSNGKTGNSIFVTQGGSYKVTATSGPGCSSLASASKTITVASAPSKPAITVTGNLDLCEGSGQTVTLRVTPTFSNYFWSNGETTRQITVDTTGSFFVRVKNSSGCFSPYSDTFHVNSYPQPPVPVLTQTGPSFFCAGDSTLLEGPPGYAAYHWSDGRSTPSVWITNSQSLYLYVTNSHGCNSLHSDTFTFSVTNLSKPVITASGPLNFCSGNSVTLSVPIGLGIYQWSTGDTTAQIVVTQTGNYSLTVSNGQGCMSPASDTIQVTVASTPPQPSISVQGSLTMCEGRIVTLNATGGHSYYEWSNGVHTPYNAVSVAGIYRVKVGNNSGCVSSFSDSVVVTVIPNPVKPEITRYGDTLTTGSYHSYQWLLENIPINNAKTQQFLLTEDGNYVVIVADTHGCSTTSDVFNVTGVEVREINESYVVKVYPNPNDGIFTLEFSDIIKRTIWVSDMLGKLIVAGHSAEGRDEIVLNDAKTGIYFLHASQEGQVRVFKINVIKR